MAEGKKCVAEAIREALPVAAIVLREGSAAPRELPPGMPRYIASAEQFAKLTEQPSPEGILAYLPLTVPPIWQPEQHPEGPAILLDEIQDPGNLGAILRAADWFGIRNVLLGPGTVDPFHPKVVRSSMGSLFRVNLFTVADLAAWADRCPAKCWIADLAGTPLPQAALGDQDVIVIGNEARGISPALQGHARVQGLRIPGGDRTESLNAALAAGIIFFAWRGQQLP